MNYIIKSHCPFYITLEVIIKTINVVSLLNIAYNVQYTIYKIETRSFVHTHYVYHRTNTSKLHVLSCVSFKAKLGRAKYSLQGVALALSRHMTRLYKLL